VSSRLLVVGEGQITNQLLWALIAYLREKMKAGLDRTPALVCRTGQSHIDQPMIMGEMRWAAKVSIIC
jgi:hypothetical protein